MTRQANRQIKTIVGENIRAAREVAELTQRQLAERIDMESMNVSRWERGKVLPSMASLVVVAEVLGREVSWFYDDHAGRVAA